jgi:hypothetical protein
MVKSLSLSDTAQMVPKRDKQFWIGKFTVGGE